MTFVSPIAGVVTAKNVVQGARVSPGEAPYEITDLGEVWVMADAYESDVARIRPGMQATLTLPAYPDRTFRGQVSFIDPMLDPQDAHGEGAHALHESQARAQARDVRRGDPAKGSPEKDCTFPADAVIRAGTKDVVFLSSGDGRFEPRVVQLGDKNGDQVEVTAGLAAGQEVVTRANFLIDSESQLRASLPAVGGK